MKRTECDQMKIDNDWSLARVNACHLGVQNEEMGELRDEMIILRTDVTSEINLINQHIGKIGVHVQGMMWIWGVIVVIIIGLVIKQMWGKK